MDIGGLFDLAEDWREEQSSKPAPSNGKKTTAQFVAEAKALHGERYDYSHVEYVNAHVKVEIVCKEHGIFKQSPSCHLKGHNCIKCTNAANGLRKRLPQDEFVSRSKAVHGDLYDYSKVRYRAGHQKVEIVCQAHGAFWQTPVAHMAGYGCRRCGDEYRGAVNRRYGKAKWEAFVGSAKGTELENYDYSRSNYIRMEDPIEIVCSRHGPFWQTPDSHILGRGCPKCGQIKKEDSLRLGINEFVRRAREKHGDKYSYELAEYKNSQTSVEIICPKHGVFSQRPERHMQGQGCWRCAAAGRSKGEESVADFLRENRIEFATHNRKIICPKELDFVIPSRKVAIEYHGTFWHSDRYHRTDQLKYELAHGAGYRLIVIWEHDWQNERTRPIMESMLLNACGRISKDKIGARQCRIVPAGKIEARNFLDRHHINGCGTFSEAIGLTYSGETVAVMTFSRAKASGEWVLMRYATSAPVIGGASRVFKSFIGSHSPSAVYAVSDKQHFTGNLFRALGFEYQGDLSRDYKVWHTKTGIRSKSDWHGANLHEMLAEISYKKRMDPELASMSDKAIQDRVKAFRVYDLGKRKWKWVPLNKAS